MKITNPLRACLGCGRMIAANRWAVHARSDACEGRPMPVPERCACRRTWPCLRCSCLELLALGFSRETTAERMGIRVGRVHSMVDALARYASGTPKL